MTDGNVSLGLPPKAVEVLLVLLEHPGEMVSRDALRETVWGDVSVEEGNLSKNIYLLRNALTERLGEGEVIRTFPKRGYQYVGPVEVETAAETSEAVEPRALGFAQARGLMPAWMGWALAVGCVLAALGAGAAWMQRSRLERGGTGDASSVLLPPADLVTDWRAVTHFEAEDRLGVQALSPSGGLLAYRQGAETYVRATDGGEARRLALPEDLAVEAISWYPDERRLLVSGAQGGEGQGGGRRGAWVVGVEGTAATQVLQDASRASVSPDGKRIAYGRSSDTELWEADGDGRNSRRLGGAAEHEKLVCVLWSAESDRVVVDWERVQPQAATDGSRGAVGQLNQQRQWTYQSYEAGSGKVLASQAGLHFESGALLGDGRLLYPMVTATGVARVAVLSTAPATGAILAVANKLGEEIGQQSYGASNLSASRDGKRVAVTLERNAVDVYAGVLRASKDGYTLGEVARVTRRAGTGYPTAWSPDGGRLLFDEGNGQNFVIAETVAGKAGGTGTGGVGSNRVIADTGGRAVQGQFTPDGRWILFLHYGGPRGQVQSIDRVSASGGSPAALITAAGLEDFHCSRSAAGRCVYRTRKRDREDVYSEFNVENGAAQEVARVAGSAGVLGDWSLSPDGRTLATTNHDAEHPSVRLIALPHFVGVGHAGGQPGADPSGGGGAPGNGEISVVGYGTILGPSWDAQGKGFFVSAHSAASYVLLYVDLGGKVSLLMRSNWPVWGVPSRDGEKLAFPSVTAGNINVWVGKVG